MSKLIIEGNIGQLRSIAKQNKIRASRRGLVMYFEDSEEPKKVQQTEYPLNVVKTVLKIKGCKDLGSLKEFESDERVTIIKALSKRVEELK